VMSKQLASREHIKTSKESATRRKEVASRQIASVSMGTLTHSTFEMLLHPRNTKRKSVHHYTQESFSCLTSSQLKITSLAWIISTFRLDSPEEQSMEKIVS
jgi:hypothetical protein